MRIIFTYCFILFNTLCHGQTFEVSIQNAQTHEPIAGAVIRGNDTQLLTDSLGVASVSAGVYSFQKLGFQTETLELNGEQIIFLNKSTTRLNEVEINAYELTQSWKEVAAPVAFLSDKDLRRFDDTQVVQAFNTLTGVRMEERSPASFRLNIRGSSLRAPFGVRNVKVYWDGIPFTEPEGNTPFNLLDISQFDRVEVIKGPAGSIYGAGTGGVVTLDSRVPETTPFGADLTQTFGSFGLNRSELNLNSSTGAVAYQAHLSHQSAEGYRDHSAMQRTTALLKMQFAPDKDRLFRFLIAYSDLQYQIPGALTLEQLNENRRMARPGSEDQNSSIHLRSLRLGMNHEYQINENWDWSQSFYGSMSFFDHPFILDYKRDSRQEVGFRTVVRGRETIGSKRLDLTIGAEGQFGRLNARNFGNVSGQADTLRFDDEITSLHLMTFAQANMDWGRGFRGTLGLSYNYFTYDIFRLIDFGVPGQPLQRRFEPQLAPRLALSKDITSQITAFASISYGFSPPTIQEVRTNEGSINEDLEAERGVSYEMGWKYLSTNSRWIGELNVFSFTLDETITTRVNEQGVVLFQNVGSTLQNGVEFMLKYKVLDRVGASFTSFDLGVNYTYHDFVFDDYQRGDNDFSGNALTGVAPHIFVLTADLESYGFMLNFTHNFTDAIPLNDQNTVFSDAYHFQSVRLSKEIKFSSYLDMRVFVGVNNLLNQQFSLGDDLNAFGGRFFQPAAERNYFGGLKLVF
ncbi:MAG: TonB-dependent receptor [Cyclobacteriaceae bacterium]|nr:TonB-dependent receptor [Cyclobacteriaceae bacterium]MCH8516717.1 TonB-dependent receptor [Cyclobacteriaceae bacterium]